MSQKLNVSTSRMEFLELSHKQGWSTSESFRNPDLTWDMLSICHCFLDFVLP